MVAYFYRLPAPPRALSSEEQTRLLRTTGEHRKGLRDHILFSLALATGLREHEVLALDVGDLLDERGKIRRRVPLRVYKRSNSDEHAQEVFLSETMRAKLGRFLHWKTSKGESTAPEAPLFISAKKNRLSSRQFRTLFRKWRQRAGIDRPYTVHSLRHASCTNIYQQTKDLRLTQRFARHRSILSTERYAHPSTEELVRAVQELPC